MDHGQRKHALLSASGATRWVNCTPSARLEEQFEDSDDSFFSKEGTLAHEFGDVALKKFNKGLKPREVTKILKDLRASEFYSDEMEGEVEKYTSYVLSEFRAARRKTKDSILSVEERINLTDFIEDGFGTGDAIIIGDGCLEVIDLKYGKGVKVSAKDNAQLRLYGLGALVANDFLYSIDRVKYTIVQPRLDWIDSEEMSAEDLKAWGRQIIKPAAEQAYKGEGLQQAGDWCKWCKAKARCATIASRNLKLAQHDFKSPHFLTGEQLLGVYHQIPRLTDWAKAVGDYILAEAKAGKKWQGLKLVEGRSSRKWVDEGKVEGVLAVEGFERAKFINEKLAGIGAVEKLVGKQAFTELLGDLIIKPQGAPTLVGESDKRPAIGIDQAKEDFKN